MELFGIISILAIGLLIIWMIRRSNPSTTTSTVIVGDHAIVIGAGIAGLLSARVLSKRFNKVTIIERDTLPNEATVRRGCPQATQFHAVIKRGMDGMEKLFPGY